MASTGADGQVRLRYAYRSNSVATLTDHETAAFAVDPDAKSAPHPKELKLYFTM